MAYGLSGIYPEHADGIGIYTMYDGLEDEFGDIIIGDEELAIIRGGWEDRQGNYYNDVPDGNKIGPLNVFCKNTVSNDLYSNLQQNAFNNLRRNRGTTPAISSNAPTTSTRTTGQLGGPNTLTDSNYGT